MKSQVINKLNLPDTPGVYYFLNEKGEILYIGKATSLRDRVRSYFSQDVLKTRGPLIAKLLEEVKSVGYKNTDSALEALMLEAGEIRKYHPPYNSKEKDNKSFNFVLITKEDFPCIVVERERSLRLQDTGKKSEFVFGPFPKGSELKEALKIIRKIFPFRDKCKLNQKRPCFNAQIGLCPGVCVGRITKTEYRKNIRHIKLLFEAKKPQLIKSLEREMNLLAKKKKFEEAEQVKRRLFALEHIQDVALIKRDSSTQAIGYEQEAFRIEAYDIAHMAGRDTVGVMTVVVDGELDKSQYRKFKIKLDSNNDTENLKEVIRRRLGHLEWSLPELIVVDGGKAQINSAKSVLKERGFNIDVVSVVKDERHKPKEILGMKKYVEAMGKDILLANLEAHRFAVEYHRKLRSKGFRI